MQTSTETRDELVYKQYKLVVKFRDFMIAGNLLSKNTVKNYLSDIRHYLGYVHGYFPDSFNSYDFTNSHVIYEYRQYLLTSINSQITIKRRLSAVHKFIDFLKASPNSLPRSNVNTVKAPEQVDPENSRIPKDSSNYYLNSIIQEYSFDRKINKDDKNYVRDFLLFVHK